MVLTAASHLPVMVDRVAGLLRPRPGATFVDATLGLGGHAEGLLAANEPDGRVIGLDRDPAVGGAGLQQPLAVAAQAEGGVDVGPAGTGPEHLDDPVDHDRDVGWQRQHHQIPSSARWAALVSSA